MKMSILVLILGSVFLVSCKKCTTCSLEYEVPLGGITGFSEDKYCGKEEEIARYEASFKAQYESYGIIKCARD